MARSPVAAELARNLWSLFKVRISLAIMLCAVAGIAVTPGTGLTAAQGFALALAVFLSAASAGAFNHFVERDLDSRMARTRKRPFVTGYFRYGPAWLAMILALLAASVALAGAATNWLAAGFVFLGAFVYGVVYTVWLKRRSWLNIVLGGLAGSFAVLAGAAAADPALATVPLLLAAVLFLWTPPHFWSLATVLHDEYRRAGVPMLPVVAGNSVAAWVTLGHTVALVALSVVPVWYGMGPIYLVGALLGGAYFLNASLRFVHAPGPAAAAVNFKASLVQLSLLLLAAIADRGLLA
jgi:protoheme IX farnesyltransferase